MEIRQVRLSCDYLAEVKQVGNGHYRIDTAPNKCRSSKVHDSCAILPKIGQCIVCLSPCDLGELFSTLHEWFQLPDSWHLS